MKEIFTALRALLYMAGFVWLWAWIALGLRTYDSRFSLRLTERAEPLGIFVMACGGLLAMMSVAAFVIWGKGTPAPFDAPPVFVAVGPYRYVRNPMYIGAWFTLIGFGLYEHSMSILTFSLIWVLVAHLFVIIYEEPNLERRFGQSYLDYKKSVRRWIPNIN